MRNATATHTIDCNIETFWKLFLDEAYNKRFYLDELGFKEFEILEMTDTLRRLRGVPKLNMPKPVMMFFGDSFGYEEVASLDRDKNEWRWKVIPNTMRDKLRTEGVIRLEAMGNDKCRRIDEVNLEAKVFGIGGLIESSTEKEVRDAWEKETRFMNRWLAGN